MKFHQCSGAALVLTIGRRNFTHKKISWPVACKVSGYTRELFKDKNGVMRAGKIVKNL